VGGQRLQVGQHLDVAPLLEQAVEAFLDGPCVQLGQAGGFDAGVVDLSQLLVGDATPPTQSFGQASLGGRGVTGSHRSGVVDGGLETGGVDAVGPQVEPVPAWCGADRTVREQPAQAEHVGLEGGLVVGG
jgi:hypothetical protein